MSNGTEENPSPVYIRFMLEILVKLTWPGSQDEYELCWALGGRQVNLTSIFNLKRR